MISDQQGLFIWNNQNLFSNNYLENRLPLSDLWKTQTAQAATVFNDLKAIYESTRPLNLGSGQEAALEDRFIKPVLRVLGYKWDVQPNAAKQLRQNPDYALFKDESSYELARKNLKFREKYYSYPLTILEAKYWGRRLNDADPEDSLDRRDPTAQTVKYLDNVYHLSNSSIKWAVLTNGKLWRLFYHRAASRSGNYFEVDLEEIILAENPEKFLYFYLFFSKEAFIEDPATGKTWLDVHLKETEDYATKISNKLKERIFDNIFEGLASGFIEYRRNELSVTEETEESLKETFNACLKLLYRLLFLLYAESRLLLPVDDKPRYFRKSLKKLKEDIAEYLKNSGLDNITHNAYDYWSRLESLFRIIEKGDRNLNIPVYNGGLFEPGPDDFLHKHKISDYFVAKAVDALTVDSEGADDTITTQFIDYSSLNVRHLGDIYEGLLEFHIRVAAEDMVETKEKGKSFWTPASGVKAGTRIQGRKAKGEIYIENSKHERKASGSYYTPHYIVEYIVKNTVGPVIEDRFGRSRELFIELEQLYAKQRKQLKKPYDWKYWEHIGEAHGKHALEIEQIEQEIIETLFDIKVLDPAMGSGHFLVHTVDFISDRIITFLSEYPDNPVMRRLDRLRNDIVNNIREQNVTIDESKLTEVNLVKRMVMKRCIYGVDLNEMAVELAKLSLWLDSFTLGAPLSFLDHHLKCGNSLIGVMDVSSVIVPGSEMHGKVQRALSYMHQVSELTDATLTEAKESYNSYKKGREAIEPVIRRFDIVTARHFMSYWSNRLEQLAYTLAYDKEEYQEIIDACKQGLAIAKEKRFFHWKAEFPEVFYAEKGEKNEPGFDCVIGNPPYIGFHGFEEVKQYLKNNYMSCAGKFDIYIPFIELIIKLSRENGKGSYICQNGFMKRDHGKQLRRMLIEMTRLEYLHDFKDYQIFDGATNYTCIIILSNTRVSGDYEFIYSFGDDLTADKKNVSSLKTLTEQSWDIITDNILDGLQEIGSVKPLKEVAVLISEGIVTGQNDVFVISKNSIREDSIFTETDIVKKALKGDSVDRYEINWDNTYLIYPYKLIDHKTVAISEQELIKHEFTNAYLKSREKELSGRSYFDESSKNWFELWNQRDLSHQSGRKIIVQENSARNEFVVDDGNYYYLDTCCGISLNSKYLLSDLYVLSLLNSKLLDYVFKQITVPKAGGCYIHKPMFLGRLPIRIISFTTSEPERSARVAEAIERYQSFMLDLDRGHGHEDKKDSAGERGAVAERSVACGKETTVSGEHSGAGERVHGVRGRARKQKDAERVSEEPEEYSSTTRYLESSLGIKSYAELAPYLAQGVERVMAELLDREPAAIRITPDFICNLHRDAFRELFPSWAGCYRDRDVSVGGHKPPPYFEIPILMRQYCEDLEARLAALGEKPEISEMLLEALAFAEGRFLSIHPFLDFNGRVARMLLFALLYRFDLPPVPLLPDEKDRAGRKQYFDALASADQSDWLPLVDVWKRRLWTGQGL